MLEKMVVQNELSRMFGNISDKYRINKKASEKMFFYFLFNTVVIYFLKIYQIALDIMASINHHNTLML